NLIITARKTEVLFILQDPKYGKILPYILHRIVRGPVITDHEFNVGVCAVKNRRKKFLQEILSVPIQYNDCDFREIAHLFSSFSLPPTMGPQPIFRFFTDNTLSKAIMDMGNFMFRKFIWVFNDRRESA